MICCDVNMDFDIEMDVDDVQEVLQYILEVYIYDIIIGEEQVGLFYVVNYFC